MTGNAFDTWLARQWTLHPGLSESQIGTLARLRSGPESGNRAVVRDAPQGAIRVLMLLCQKPDSTGSGVVFREIAARMNAYGITCTALCAANDGQEQELELEENPPLLNARFVPFASDLPSELRFPIVGMSNSMPYRSLAFRDLSLPELESYTSVWLRYIERAVEEFQPHIMHVHHLWLLSAIAAMAAPQLPVIVSIHGTDLHRAADCPHMTALVREWVSCHERFLALTPESMELARSYYDIPAKRFLILGNGFDPVVFHPHETVNPILHQYRLEKFEGKKLVFFVGKFVKWKGLAYVIQALAEVKANLPDVALIIAGDGPAEEREEYERLIRTTKLTHDVALIGHVTHNDVAALMNVSTLVVLPSYSEPFGLVLLEALACGSRIVATAQGGPPYFVPLELQRSGDAILIPGLPSLEPDDSAQHQFIRHLAHGIKEQLLKPLSFRQRLRIASKVLHLTWSRYLEKLQEVYRSAVHPQ